MVDGLEPSTQYTLSVKEVKKDVGPSTVAGVNVDIVNLDTGTLRIRDKFDFTRGKQVLHFSTMATPGNWAV